MTRRHYIVMISLIVLTFILNLPHIFFKLPVFEAILKTEKTFFLLSHLIGGVLYWVSFLYYLKIKTWKFSFFSGMALGIANISLSIAFYFIGESFDPRNLQLMMFLLLLCAISRLIFSVSFLTSKRTRNHPLIRISAVISLTILIIDILSIPFPIINELLLTACLTVVEAILLVLHLVRERHNDYQHFESDEILDIS